MDIHPWICWANLIINQVDCQDPSLSRKLTKRSKLSKDLSNGWISHGILVFQKARENPCLISNGKSQVILPCSEPPCMRFIKNQMQRSSPLPDGRCRSGTHPCWKNTWRQDRLPVCSMFPTWVFTRSKEKMQHPSWTQCVPTM